MDVEGREKPRILRSGVPGMMWFAEQIYLQIAYRVIIVVPPQATNRPDFMVLLGLIPPYSVDDVKQAYLQKARTVHPDHGGATENFVALQQAFEQATEYAKFRESRLNWLGGQVERYANQELIVAKLREFGCRVDVEPVDWLTKSFGADFAQVADRLVGIHCDGASANDELVDFLASEQSALSEVRHLTLANGSISAAAALRIGALQGLHLIDLHGTRLRVQAFHFLALLPNVEEVRMAHCGIGPIGRIRLRLRHRGMRFVA